MEIRLIKNAVLVEVEEHKSEEILQSGLIVPVEEKQTFSNEIVSAKIAVIGIKQDPVSLDDLKVGDLIFFQYGAAEDVVVDKKYKMIRGVDILAVERE